MIKGIGVSPGIVCGKVFLMAEEEVCVIKRIVPKKEIKMEMDRFKKALLKTKNEMKATHKRVLKELGRKHARLFYAYLLILEDTLFTEDVIEYEEFVKGENSEDQAISDIFKFKDKGKRKLALRYEFTFQLKRLMNNKKLPYKRFQIGPVFRDEPVSANRFRQFIQCDIDTIGSTVKDEAEVLVVVKDILENFGLKPIMLINNRKLLDEILKDNNIKEKDKEQVLREIDNYDEILIMDEKA